MAKREVVTYDYTCDVCGDPIPDSAFETATRKVSWEGVDYVVDVCETHGSQLREVLIQLTPFVEAGHRDSGRRGRRPNAAPTAVSRSAAPSAKRGDMGVVRAWARDNGYKVSERGRIPAALLATYDAANRAGADGGTPSADPAGEGTSATTGRKAAGRKAAARKRGARKSAPTAA